jgi:stage III sporulation protein AF
VAVALDVLRNIVQNILIIIMLTTLLEMLLPKGDMRRYVRLVMGLFIIMVVLHPVLSLFNGGVNMQAVGFNAGPQDGGLAAAVSKGKKLGEEQKSRALAGLQEKINGQVMALARLDKTVKVTDVQVEMVDDPQSENFGQIKNIIVKTGAGAGAKASEDNKGVVPVEVDIPGIDIIRPREKTGTPAVPRDSGQLQEILADFYGLAPEQVKIIR